MYQSLTHTTQQRPPAFEFGADGAGAGANGGTTTLMYAIRNGSARLGTFVAYRGRAGGYQPGG